jgi:foldase protein PrsA
MRPPVVYGFVIAVSCALSAVPAVAQDVLVVVDGQPISREALVHRLLDLSTAGQAQLDEMINEALLSQAAEKQGITVSDAEIDARMAQLKAALKTDDDFKRYLAGQEVTEAGLRQRLRVKILVAKLLGPKAQVTDAEVKEVYDANKASFEKPETVTLSIILTKTKERADEALKRLGKGESFPEVAKAVSEHAYTAQRGGVLGQRARTNLSPALAAAAFKTEVGAYTQPIETEDGYYILKVDERTAARNQSFDDVKDAIREQLGEMKLQDVWVGWLTEARAKAAIERKWHP